MLTQGVGSGFCRTNMMGVLMYWFTMCNNTPQQIEQVCRAVFVSATASHVTRAEWC